LLAQPQSDTSTLDNQNSGADVLSCSNTCDSFSNIYDSCSITCQEGGINEEIQPLSQNNRSKIGIVFVLF
jgi:hypothetical protein